MREMKNSGVEWIGMIPEKRNLIRLDKITQVTKGKKPASDNCDGIGMPIIGASEMNGAKPSLFTMDNVPTCCNEDVIVLWDGANAGLVACGLAGVVSSTAARIRLLDKHHSPRFIYYVYKAAESYYREKVSGTTIPHMNTQYLKNTFLVDFSIAEQNQIANFLDRKCADIDNVIEKTKASIEGYKKFKQSVITEAVTKGVHGERPMKDSGIEWIGDYPSDWTLTKVKWLLNERNERSQDGSEESLSMSQKFGLIPTKEMDTIPNMASSFVGAKLTHKGDLVFNKLKAHLGVFAVSKYDGLVSPDYAVYYKTERADMRYLEYLFKTPQYILEFRKRSSGVGAGLTRLYTGDLFAMYSASPSLLEQQEIASYLDQKCFRIDTLIKNKERLIKELEAYRKSLIYEYVTGKKEVL